MRAKVKENKFKPFDLVITIESEADLSAIWYKLNAGRGLCEDMIDSCDVKFISEGFNGINPAWSILDELIETRYAHLKENES